MENIEAHVIEDSICSSGNRLTTFQLRYPRFIHSEFMTHRVFSRNASSSRAIPVEILLEQIRVDPAKPEHWGANQSGMQANAELQGAELANVIRLWEEAADSAAGYARSMAEAGLHKQVANRVIEPFCRISVIVTATEWDNFFELRAHADAQPEIRILAEKMGDVMMVSTPTELDYGQWHLPYVSTHEREVYNIETVRKISAARCARVSYLTHDGKKSLVENDIKLYDRLVGSVPIHASPVEHQATPKKPKNSHKFSRNFKGWDQFRAIVEDRWNSV